MVALLAACATARAEPFPFPAPALWNEPPASPPPASPTPRITLTPSPGPTATPLVHLVAKGETLGTIASKYGVTLAALRAANPDVEERLLSIGQALIIPVEDAAATPYGTPTPAPLAAGAVRCWLQAAGGRVCLADLRNPGSQPLGHVIVRFALFDDPAGEPVAVQEMDLPLAVLPAGARMPVMAMFPPDAARGATGHLEVLSAIPDAGTAGLLSIEWGSSSYEMLAGGLEARADFRLDAAAKRLDALLGLRNAAGEWIGYRLERLEGDWRPGELNTLTLRAYSLGEAVADYRLFAEAWAD